MTVATPGSDSSMQREPGHGRRVHTAIKGSQAGLAIWTDQSDSRCVLRLSGRLVSDTVRLLGRHVDLLGCQSCEQVTIDLTRLEGMDQVGARVIVGLGHYVAARNGRLEIEGAAPHVAALLARAEVELSA